MTGRGDERRFCDVSEAGGSMIVRATQCQNDRSRRFAGILLQSQPPKKQWIRIKRMTAKENQPTVLLARVTDRPSTPPLAVGEGDDDSTRGEDFGGLGRHHFLRAQCAKLRSKRSGTIGVLASIIIAYLIFGDALGSVKTVYREISFADPTVCQECVINNVKVCPRSIIHYCFHHAEGERVYIYSPNLRFGIQWNATVVHRIRVFLRDCYLYPNCRALHDLWHRAEVNTTWSVQLPDVSVIYTYRTFQYMLYHRALPNETYYLDLDDVAGLYHMLVF